MPVVVMIMVMVVVMIVPPVPIFLLLIVASLAELAMVAVRLDLPALVVDNFVVIPHVVVLISGVICGIRSPRCTATEHYG